MYLSKLILDVNSPSVRQSLRDCQDMHRSLMNAVDGARSEVKLLYRTVTTREQISVIVLSGVQPVWERIDAMGYHCVQMRDVSELPARYREGACLRFSLLACPSKKVKGDGKNSRRVYLASPTERMAWLKRQADKYGFALLEAHEAGAEVKLKGKHPSGEVFLTAMPFEGVLQITDADAFWQAWLEGIGPEKAYGAGLMMLSRI